MIVANRFDNVYVISCSLRLDVKQLVKVLFNREVEVFKCECCGRRKMRSIDLNIVLPYERILCADCTRNMIMKNADFGGFKVYHNYVIDLISTINSPVEAVKEITNLVVSNDESFWCKHCHKQPEDCDGDECAIAMNRSISNVKFVDVCQWLYNNGYKIYQYVDSHSDNSLEYLNVFGKILCK